VNIIIHESPYSAVQFSGSGKRGKDIAEIILFSLFCSHIVSVIASPNRVLCDPPPSQATMADLIRVNEAEGRLCELVDGTLVEKAKGWEESWLASVLGHFLMSFLDGSIVSGLEMILMLKMPSKRAKLCLPFATGLN
jgi:hypothetical protein